MFLVSRPLPVLCRLNRNIAAIDVLQHDRPIRKISQPVTGTNQP